MQKLLIASILLLTSCTSVVQPKRRDGDVQLRVSGGMVASELQTSSVTTFFGQTYVIDEEFKGTMGLGRIELNQPMDGAVIGVYLDGGLVDYGEVDAEHLAAGLILRYHFADGALRPFVEGRGGYRGTQVGDFYGNGFDAGVAAGLELGLTRSLSTHIQVGYDLGSTNARDIDSDLEGITVMIGGSVNF